MGKGTDITHQQIEIIIGDCGNGIVIWIKLYSVLEGVGTAIRHVIGTLRKVATKLRKQVLQIAKPRPWSLILCHTLFFYDFFGETGYHPKQLRPFQTTGQKPSNAGGHGGGNLVAISCCRSVICEEWHARIFLVHQSISVIFFIVLTPREIFIIIIIGVGIDIATQFIAIRILAYMTKVCLKSSIPLLSIRGMELYKVLNEDLSSFRTNPLM